MNRKIIHFHEIVYSFTFIGFTISHMASLPSSGLVLLALGPLLITYKLSLSKSLLFTYSKISSHNFNISLSWSLCLLVPLILSMLVDWELLFRSGKLSLWYLTVLLCFLLRISVFLVSFLTILGELSLIRSGRYRRVYTVLLSGGEWDLWVFVVRKEEEVSIPGIVSELLRVWVFLLLPRGLYFCSHF